MLWVIYPTEDCSHAAEVVKPLWGVKCTLRCSGATGPASILDVGCQMEVASEELWHLVPFG